MTNQSTSERVRSLVQGSGTRFFVHVCLVVVVVVRAKLNTAAESVGEGCCRSCVTLGEGEGDAAGRVLRWGRRLSRG